MSAAAISAPRRRRRFFLPRPFDLFAGCVAVAASALILYPLVRIIADVFAPGGTIDLSPFTEALEEPNLGGLLLSTLGVVIGSTAIALAIGAIFAWLNERSDIGMERVMRSLPIVPLMLPPLAGAIGWVLLAAPSAGFLNSAIRALLGLVGITLGEGPLTIFSWSGLVFIYVLYLIPEVYLTIAAGLRNLDPGLEEAALMSGARPWRIVWTITLPNVLPAIGTAAVLSLLTAFSLFSVPIIIGSQAHVPVLSVRIVELMTAGFPPKVGTALVFGLIIMALIAAAWRIQARVIRAGRYAKIGGRGMRAARIPLGRLRPIARGVMLAYLAMTTALPFGALLLVGLLPYWTPNVDLSLLTLRHYQRVLGNPFYREALMNSVLLGAVGATIGVALAAVMAFFVDRHARSYLAIATDGVAKLPGAVSHLVIGIACVAAFAGPPFRLHGTIVILLIAYVILYIPQASLTARSALAQVGPELTEASLMSGASMARTFVSVTLPLMAPGLIVGWALLFVLIAGEITASSMLAGTSNPVIGFVVLDLWTNGSYSGLAALGTLITVLMSTIVLTALALTRGRRA